MNNIYELTGEIKKLESDLLDSVDYETGEVDEVIVKALDVTREEFNARAVGCVNLSDKFNAYIAAIDSEIARLNALKKAYKKSADRLKNGVSTAMLSLGINEITTDTMRLSFRRSEEAIIDNIDFLPAEYVKVKTEYQADKIAIKKAINNKIDVPGAHIETKYNLQVK